MTLQTVIESKLREALAPSHLEVINESHMHSVPKGSETHFKVVVVSDRFEGLAPVKRHQLVYGALGEEGEHTLEEVGKRFSVTRERIRQIETKALRKLRHPLRGRALKAFVEN